MQIREVGGDRRSRGSRNCSWDVLYERRNYLEIEINTQGHITINYKRIINDDDDKNKSLVMAGHSL